MPGMKLPYASVASSGTSKMSRSVSWMPSMRGLGLDLAPVGDAAVGAVDQPAGGERSCRRQSNSYSRRNTWCEACEV